VIENKGVTGVAGVQELQNKKEACRGHRLSEAVFSEESGVRSQESGVRSQESGVRPISPEKISA
jgi:hypothetical protein